MDKGAHFYKCDFQVHTPRDINWAGGDAVTEEERIAYATEFVLSCREKGLGAVAITDHHDFAFFPYIKAAAEQEVTASGEPLPDGDRLIVFPGLELTLAAPPCQAILLLDSDFPVPTLVAVLAKLSIVPFPAANSKHAEIVHIPEEVANNFAGLYEKLNSHTQIKGRFIILPNVTENGSRTLLRRGFHKIYEKMPCVGGYTDGSALGFSDTHKSKVEGKIPEYGYKAIAIFQTSDNRKRNHEDLGAHTTWVKWSEPSAEAIRQACLAKESRLSLTDPELPSLWITSVSVTNSKFLGKIDLDLNQQYNSLIGGRGTGKSTILEYIRWCLCDQMPETDELAVVAKRRKNLIDTTLQAFEGEVHISFILNGVSHIVKRNSKSKELAIRIGDAPFVPATEEQVRNLLPIQAYSQKQLSDVAVRIDELKRFVELPIIKDLVQVSSELKNTESKLRTSYSNLIRTREIERELTSHNLEIGSLTEQIDTLRKGLRGLSNEDQKTIADKVKYEYEEALIRDYESKYDFIATTIKELGESIEASLLMPDSAEDEPVGIVNTTLLSSIREAYAEHFAKIRASFTTLLDLLGQEELSEIRNKVNEWHALNESFLKRYEAAKERASANREQLEQIRQIETRIATLKDICSEKKRILKSLGDPFAFYNQHRALWDALHTRKLTLMSNQCLAFTGLSKGLIKAEMSRSLDKEALLRMLKTAFSGMNIREEKIDRLCARVLEATNPMNEWNAILGELELLAQLPSDVDAFEQVIPILKACNFKESETNRLAASLTPSKWLDLSLFQLDFHPNFSYCTNSRTSVYIDFANASAGQQATALLTVLLNQPGAPLIIDQPEDDIDSKMIDDIVKQVWNTKKRRQLIFASHNANIVVNGDAELVVCFGYASAGDHTNGVIMAQGAIDKAEIKREITEVTEGGEKAFKLRKEKYGF